MNLFMPYNSVIESVRALDDRRLIKQILECKVLLDRALGKGRGHVNHPVSVHYKDYPDFIKFYGLWACIEYYHRFDRTHKYQSEFSEKPVFEIRIPPILYAAGSKGSSNCIRKIGNVHVLFQKKLIEKWDNDKIHPKWTKRDIPEFYKRRAKNAE